MIQVRVNNIFVENTQEPGKDAVAIQYHNQAVWRMWRHQAVVLRDALTFALGPDETPR